MNLKKNKRIGLVIIIYLIFVVYLFVILTILKPAIDDYLNSPVVEKNSYTLTIPTQIGDDNITVFLSFRTDSPAFWTEEAIYVRVELAVPFNKESCNYRIRIPYSSYAYPTDDYIEYDYIPEPHIDLVEAEGPSFYYHGKTIIAYHIRGYFDVIVEERDDNKTVINSVILEDVIEVSSHTDRMGNNVTRIQLAMSIILFVISIILFYHRIQEIKNRTLEDPDDNESGKKPESSESPHQKEDSNKEQYKSNEKSETNPP